MPYQEDQDGASWRHTAFGFILVTSLHISITTVSCNKEDGYPILPRHRSQYHTNVAEHEIFGVDHHISVSRGFNVLLLAARRPRRVPTTKRMDQLLQSWQRRHRINSDAYMDLISILGSTPEAEQNIGEGEIFTEHLNNPAGPFQVEASLLKIPSLSPTNKEFNAWPVDNFMPPADDDWHRVIRNAQQVLSDGSLPLLSSSGTLNHVTPTSPPLVGSSY
jgi:hypothetical protein